MQRDILINNKIVSTLHIPKKEKEIGIIICHGFLSNKDDDLIIKLAKFFETNGFLTIRFNFSNWDIKEEIKELREIINFMKMYKEKILVVGHSLGGLVSVLEYCKYKNFDYAILLAPALKLNPLLESFINWSLTKYKNKKYVNFYYIDFKKHKINLKFFKDLIKYTKNINSCYKKFKIPHLIILAKVDPFIDNSFFEDGGYYLRDFHSFKKIEKGYSKILEFISHLIAP